MSTSTHSSVRRWMACFDIRSVAGTLIRSMVVRGMSKYSSRPSAAMLKVDSAVPPCSIVTSRRFRSVSRTSGMA